MKKKIIIACLCCIAIVSIFTFGLAKEKEIPDFCKPILGSVSKVARMQQGREEHAKNIGEPKGESANESNNHQYEVIRWRGVLK